MHNHGSTASVIRSNSASPPPELAAKVLTDLRAASLAAAKNSSAFDSK